MPEKKSIREKLVSEIGFCPKDSIAWLYAARGYFKLQDYHSVIECVAPALRNDKTKREAQHLLAFAFLHTGQNEAALGAFFKSATLGNDTVLILFKI
jgi:Tfp pilus assembly protein PilF